MFAKDTSHITRVLGVDPGITRCGLGLIEGTMGRKVVALDVDVIRTAPDSDTSHRLLIISKAVNHWINVHKPDVVAIERVFAQSNVRTVMTTAQVSGIVMLSAAQNNIPVHFYTPTEVKAAVTGNGRADKHQVTTMITKILGLQKAPKPADAADALALGICHIFRYPMLNKITQMELKKIDLVNSGKRI